MNHTKTKNRLFPVCLIASVVVATGCTKQEKAVVAPPVPPPAANAPASATGAPSAEMLEREKQNTARAMQSSKEGEERFKEYLKNKK